MFSRYSELPLCRKREHSEVTSHKALWGSLTTHFYSSLETENRYSPLVLASKNQEEKKEVTLFIRTLNKENFRIDFTGSFEMDRKSTRGRNLNARNRNGWRKGAFEGKHSAFILAPSMQHPSVPVGASGEGWEPGSPGSQPHALEHTSWETAWGRASEHRLGAGCETCLHHLLLRCEPLAGYSNLSGSQLPHLNGGNGEPKSTSPTLGVNRLILNRVWH